jgi:exosortase A
MDVSRRPGGLTARGKPATALTAAPLIVGDARTMPGSSAAYRWRMALLAIALSACVFGFVFASDVTLAVHVWIESTAYNHCFLILPLVGFLLWERRAVIASISPSPALWPLLFMPFLTAVWLVAAILDINEGRQLALVAMFEVVLLVALGPQAFRRLLAPLLFLFFLVPSGAFLVPSLQTVTAKIVVAGLHVLHIPVFSDGNMIEIPEGNFEIAEACAGLRFLIASTVFGCFFAIVMYRSFLRRALFIALSLAVPIGANGMRALGIIVLAHLEGSAAAVEADHILYGWLFFSLVILLLIAIGMAFVERNDHRAPVQTVPRQDQPAPNPPAWRFAAAAAAAVLLAVTGPAYAALLDSEFTTSALPDAAGRVNLPWNAVADAGIGWRPVLHGADRQLLQSFAEPGSGVVVRFVALYRLRAVGNALTNSENRIADDNLWRVAQRGGAEILLNGEKVGVTSTQIVSGPRRRLVWSFYLVDGKIVRGILQTKLAQARAVLLHHAPLAAFVAVSASMDNPDDRAAGQLERFLQAMEPFSKYVDTSPRRDESGAGATGRMN